MAENATQSESGEVVEISANTPLLSGEITSTTSTPSSSALTPATPSEEVTSASSASASNLSTSDSGFPLASAEAPTVASAPSTSPSSTWLYGWNEAISLIASATEGDEEGNEQEEQVTQRVEAAAYSQERNGRYLSSKENVPVEEIRSKDEEQEADTWGSAFSLTSVVSVFQEVSGELSSAASAAARSVMEAIEEGGVPADASDEASSEVGAVSSKAGEAETEQRKENSEQVLLDTKNMEGKSVQASGNSEEKGEEAAVVTAPSVENIVNDLSGRVGSAMGGDERVKTNDEDETFRLIDESVGKFTQTLGSYWSGSLQIVQSLEHTAEEIAHSIQEGNISAKAHALAESGKEFAEKSLRILEEVGMEAMDVIAHEAGLEMGPNEPGFKTAGDANPADKERERDAEGREGRMGVGEGGSEFGEGGGEMEEEEEVTFDRCFFIYGGMDRMEELVNLSDHHSVLSIRARGKMSEEEKKAFDKKLEKVQSVLSGSEEVAVENLRNSEADESSEALVLSEEIESLMESGRVKASSIPNGLHRSSPDFVPKALERMDELKYEGIHTLSELCAACLSHVLFLGNSLIEESKRAAGQGEEKEKASEDKGESKTASGPKDAVERSLEVLRHSRAMRRRIVSLVDCFLKSIQDLHPLPAERAVEAEEGVREKRSKTELMLLDKSSALSEEIRFDCSLACQKVEEGMAHLVYVVLMASR